MNQMSGKRLSGLTVLVGILTLVFSPASVFAHGGEDHGDQKPQTVSPGTNMIVHVARAGDFELVIKHAPIEPDKEMVARVFVSRFANNEPVSGAKAIVTLTSDGGAPVELTAAAGATPGMYEVKLPPLPKGQYKLAARIDSNGETKTATLSALEVAPQPVTATGAVATWARTALIVMGVFVFLSIIGFLGVVIYRSSRASRREHIEGETAAA
ncbi:MAG TPA: hypothetical protein VJS64_02345 [Pyrinomonadaceae bacterium]|nr:hypothetical protein [Pyrinomonadaceae bacterium]HKR58546.1 hypothetical protein [Pyrinomonadaceae bacterium]